MEPEPIDPVASSENDAADRLEALHNQAAMNLVESAKSQMIVEETANKTANKTANEPTDAMSSLDALHQQDARDLLKMEQLAAGPSHRIDRLNEVFAAFDLNKGETLGLEELFEIGTARRRLGHRGGAWTKEMNLRLIKSMTGSDDPMASVMTLSDSESQ